MADEIARRIYMWMDPDEKSFDQIKQELDDSGWSQKWDQSTLNEVSREVNNIQRKSPDRRGVIERATDVMGPQGDRQSVVRDAKGRVAGKQENISTWKDRWGNVMYHNENTGTRGKLRDSDGS